MTTTPLWPTLLATWLSLAPAPAAQPTPGAANPAPATPAQILPRKD
ncbi:MAG: hypothetical protein RMK64_03715 [Rhodovarius sp.]|nr:hypothetical protein [Rhodovarius sp.]MCX7931715.1 hypothetical protein [Rhodovarius sp.]MDW8314057.1 hypothetical protein [Rhodovarius sp.]